MNEFSRPNLNMPDVYASKLRRAGARRSMQGERRVITMLFCDVTGSSEMAEDLDPEEWAEIMNAAFEFMIHPIYKYEGTVARLMGDAILAFFGAPIAHEDDPQRAVLAGLEIVGGIKPFCREIKAEYDLDFNVRVGINTGPVVVGEVGSDLALEYTAMGDAINLASRMESTAEPGSVQISELTYRLIAHLFEVEDHGLQEIKGKSDLVQTYTVTGLKSDLDLIRGIRGQKSPLIGRDKELNRLRQIVDDLIDKGEGRIVRLTSDPGLGKSRLVAELYAYWQKRREATADGWEHWAQMNAVSYGAAQPYGMIKHLLRSRYGINETDPAQEIRDKIRTATLYYPEAVRERVFQLYTILFGAEEEESGLQPMGPDFQREFFDLHYKGSAMQIGSDPTIFLAEDLQWADPISMEEIEDLFPLVEGYPALLVGTLRPEKETPAWDVFSRTAERYPEYYEEIDLQPLDTEDSAFLVDHLLSVAGMPAEVPQQILEKTGGNPFFIEEVVRELLESEAVTLRGGAYHWNLDSAWEEFTIPNSVQALLVARIDRLQKELKRTLQMASVIGPTFYERVLEAVEDNPIDLDQHLLTLEEKEFIRSINNEREAAYAFRHTMTREATYRTVLRRLRRQYHRQVAEVIESLFSERLEDEAGLLAYHYQEGRQPEKALTYSMIAAKHAGRLHAHVEAADFYDQAIDLALQLNADDQLVDLYKQLGRIYEVSGEYDHALATYHDLRTLGESRQNDVFLLQALLAEGTVAATYSDYYDPQKGRALAVEALALAKKIDHPQGQAKALWIMMLVDTYVGKNPAVVIALGEEAVAIAQEHELKEELALAYHDLARPYFYARQTGKAKESLVKAGQLWRELENMEMLADSLVTLATGFTIQGRFDEAIDLAQEALEISRAIGNAWGQSYSLSNLAITFWDKGQFQKALDAWAEAMFFAEKGNFSGPGVFANLEQAQAFEFLGDLVQAKNCLRLAMDNARRMDLFPMMVLGRMCEAKLELGDGNEEPARAFLNESYDIFELAQTESSIYLIYLALLKAISLADGRSEQVLEGIDRATAIIEQREMWVALIEVQQLKAEVLLWRGDYEAADHLLREARTTAEKFGAYRTLLPILATQAEVTAVSGNKEEQQIVKEDGQRLVAALAGNVTNPALKATFLGTPLARTFTG